MKKTIFCVFCLFLFVGLLQAEVLKPFGQDFFSSASLSGFDAGRIIPEKYYLGYGDQIEISVWGVIEQKYQMEIDREGSILIPRIGKIVLAGKNLTQAKKYIQESFNKIYKNINVELTLNKPRLISVFVMGEVKKPGTYTVNPSSSVLEALTLAGGVSERGSLRKISITSKDGHRRNVDLYPVFLGGTLPDITFQSEDIIYVPLGSQFVSIKGAVRRPAIYEVVDTLKLQTLIDFAGGFLPDADLQRITVIRDDRIFGRKIMDIFPQKDPGVLENFVLRDGDNVEISYINKDIIDCVFIEGTIKNPGRYQWKSGITVSDIIKESDLLPETLEEKAEIIRETPSGVREIMQFSLIDAIRNVKEIQLNPRDRVVIRSKDKPLKKVRITGEVKFPGEYVISPEETISSVIDRAGGFTSQAYLPGTVFTRVSVKQREQQELEKFILEKQSTLEKETERTESEEEKALIEKGKTLLQQLAQTPVTGRIVVSLVPWDKFKGSNSDIFLEDGDAIYIPTKPTIVSVLGEVNHSANILYKSGADAEYYIKKAGSYTKNADMKNIFVVKVDGTANNDLKTIEPGDVIVVGFLAKDRAGKIFKDIVQMIYYVAMAISA